MITELQFSLKKMNKLYLKYVSALPFKSQSNFDYKVPLIFTENNKQIYYWKLFSFGNISKML